MSPRERGTPITAETLRNDRARRKRERDEMALLYEEAADELETINWSHYRPIILSLREDAKRWGR